MKKKVYFSLYSQSHSPRAHLLSLVVQSLRNRPKKGQGQAQLLAEAKLLCRAVFDSAEYKNVSGRSDEDFIADLYNGYLGREPDQDGWNFWVSVYRNDLATGINGHEHMLQAFELSPEFANVVSTLEAAPPPVVCDPVDEQACWNGGGIWDPSTCFCEYPPPYYDPCYPYYCY